MKQRLMKRRRITRCAAVRLRWQQGSATVMSLAWLTILMFLGVVATMLALVMAAQHQVESAADLAAVSAATHVVEGGSVACAAASRVAVTMKAEVTSCRIDGMDVAVEVSAKVKVPLPSGTLRLSGSATAGPADGR